MSGFGGDNGPATAAEFNVASDIAISASGDLFIADQNNQRIRFVTQGTISTIAGDGNAAFSGDNGLAAAAELNYPSTVAVDASGSLYIADKFNHRIRKISNGVISTVAGDGTEGFGGDGGLATAAKLNVPTGVAVDAAGNIYISDDYNSRIRVVVNGVINTIAGNGSFGLSAENVPATTTSLYYPLGLTVDSLGNVYVAEGSANRVYILTPSAPFCKASVSSTALSAAAAGGTVNLSVQAPSACPWAVQNLPSWVAITGMPVATGSSSIALTFAANSGGPRSAVISVAGSDVTVTQLGTLPTITPGGIVPIYSNNSVIQPGSWISIFGAGFANGTSLWNNDFPTSLAGVTVSINGRLGYLWLVSPGQINLQAPDDSTTGLVNVVVTTPGGSVQSATTLALYAPSLSGFDSRYAAGVILTFDGSGYYSGGAYDLLGPAGYFSYNTRPAKAGDTVELYGVGFGPTNPQVASGKPFSGTAQTTTPVTVTIGGIPAKVLFAGLTQAGLYQINIVVPAGIPAGDQLITASVNGNSTPDAVYVTVQ